MMDAELKYTKTHCPEGHKWRKGKDGHGCVLRYCLRCSDKDTWNALWVLADCKEYIRRFGKESNRGRRHDG